MVINTLKKQNIPLESLHCVSVKSRFHPKPGAQTTTILVSVHEWFAVGVANSKGEGLTRRTFVNTSR